jgi:hypothetical protein
MGVGWALPSGSTRARRLPLEAPTPVPLLFAGKRGRRSPWALRKGEGGPSARGQPTYSQTIFAQVYGLAETALWPEKIISGHDCGGGLGRYIRGRGHTPPGAVLLPLGDAPLFSAPIVVLMRHPRSDVVARCSLVRGAAELQQQSLRGTSAISTSSKEFPAAIFFSRSQRSLGKAHTLQILQFW